MKSKLEVDETTTDFKRSLQNSTSASELLFQPERKLRISVLAQNHFAQFSAVAGAIAVQLNRVGHDTTFLPLSWASSPLNSHIKSAFFSGKLRLRAPDEQIAKALNTTTSVRVDNLKEYKIKLRETRRCSYFPGEVSLADLSGLTVESLPVGTAIRDEIIRLSQNSRPNSKIRNKALCELITNYLFVYDLLSNHIISVKPDLIVVFNGRFLPESAAVQAARSQDVPVMFYEAGGELRDFDLYSHPTHDVASLCSRMIDMGSKALTEKELIEFGDEWFTSRFDFRDTEVARYSFETFEAIPQSTDSEVDVIFFSSSSDELEFNVSNGVDNQQKEALQILYEACQRVGRRLTIRSHPNMRNKSQEDQFAWESFLSRFPECEVIDQHSDRNPYELCLRAKVVVTFASTIGIESIYLGQPTLITGPAYYSALPGVFQADSVPSVTEFLTTHPLTDKRTAYLYGAFQQVRGFVSDDMQLLNHGQAVFLGKNIGSRKSISGFCFRLESRIRKRFSKQGFLT